MMSTKRRNRSRWDSPRQPRSPVTSSSPAPAAAAAVSAPAAATTEPAAGSPPAPSAPAPSSSPNVAAANPVSDFVLDYRYELSLPAQMIASRLERHSWLDPVSDYTNDYSSHDPTGYGLQGRRYGSYTGDAPPQFEDYPSMLHSSKLLQHYQGTFQNEKAQLSGQLVSGLAPEATYSLDQERDRWRADGLLRQNPNLYGISSGYGDVAHPLPPVRSSEINSERALGGGAIDAKIIDSQAGSNSFIGGRDGVLIGGKGRESADQLPTGLQDPNLYCSDCERAFSTPYQKEAHWQSHVKCEEEHCQFEAIESKVKEHMVSEHGKRFQNLLRGSGGSLKEVEGARSSEIQRNDLENTDGKRNTNFHDFREGQREGLPTPTGVRSQDARNEMELMARKSRDKWNSRMPNSSARYFPY